MLGLGMQEMLIVAALVFVLFWAPAQLPKLGRNIGLGIKEFKNIGKEIRAAKNEVTAATTEVSRDVNSAVKDITR